MDTYKKKAIPKAIREQLWIQKVGRKFETKCKTTWCRNKINVFDFQAGHDVPECKGGSQKSQIFSRSAQDVIYQWEANTLSRNGVIRVNKIQNGFNF